jgi:hypothetical protein
MNIHPEQSSPTSASPMAQEARHNDADDTSDARKSSKFATQKHAANT